MQSENLNVSTVHEFNISLYHVGQKQFIETFCSQRQSRFQNIFFYLFRRDSPYDAVVMHPSNAGKKLEDLPEGRYMLNHFIRIPSKEFLQGFQL